MERARIDPTWPNALRWFLVQGLHHFTPWHLIETPDEGASAAAAFAREDSERRQVFVFARRQDRDDCAGLEIVDGRCTERVLVFHPTFSSKGAARREWPIVTGIHADVFAFVADRVLPDMREWGQVEDASEFEA